MSVADTVSKNRFEFLYHLYKKSNGSQSKYFNVFDLANELSFNWDTAIAIAEYLREEGLIRFDINRAQTNRSIGITMRGMKEVEQALKRPNEGTNFFPPNISNYIRVERSSNVIVQQGSMHATQNVTINQYQMKELGQILMS